MGVWFKDVWFCVANENIYTVRVVFSVGTRVVFDVPIIAAMIDCVDFVLAG